MTPCQSHMLHKVRDKYQQIADFMNDKVFVGSPGAEQVCIPLTASDFMLVPGGGAGDCLISTQDVSDL